VLYPLKALSMAPAHDSDSTDSETPKPESPERRAQSDQPGPGDSDEDSEVYEIEKILDAKRGAAGIKGIGYFVKWKGYPDEENSWVHERDAGGAKELIADFWSRQKKKTGRKSDPKPRVTTRRPAVLSVESTPERTHAPQKRGRGRPKAKLDSDDESAEEEEDTRFKKKSRKSNGATRKASPSPAPSSDRASPIVELLEPSAIKKWGTLPSWERHVDTIDTVEKTEEGDLFIYFKMKGEKTSCKENSRVCAEKFPQELIKFYEAHLKWRAAEGGQESD